MIRPILSIALVVALVLAFIASAPAADQCLYLSAGGKLAVFRIDPASGNLQSHQEIDLPGAGALTASADKRRLYAVSATRPPSGAKGKQGTPAIATFAVAPDGKLELVKSAPANLGAGYLKLDRTGSFLAGNHYGPGKVTVWKLESGVYHGETVQELALEPNAHCAVFSPDNRYLLVPATGPNKVFQNRFDQGSGKLTPHDPPFAPGPQGDADARQPRHLIFHPNKETVYTTLERLHPGVGVWKWNAAKGELAVVQHIITQPEGAGGIVITTADLHLTPDAKFLYISNRDTTERQARTGRDSIVGFSVDAESGRLALIGHTPCEHVPRSFVIDETGNYLYVAGQGDDRLGVYRIDRDNGALEKVAQLETGAGPSWVHAMTPAE